MPTRGIVASDMGMVIMPDGDNPAFLPRSRDRRQAMVDRTAQFPDCPGNLRHARDGGSAAGESRQHIRRGARR
jgi:hypothetical protein